MKRLILLIFVVSIIVLPSCEDGRTTPFTAYISAMDTDCSITLYSDEEMAQQCKETLLMLESRFSVTLSGSPVNALNSGKTVKADTHLKAIIEKSNELYRLTDGTFNPCVYPLVRLWGFTGEEYSVPDDEEIKATVAQVADSYIKVKGDSALLKGMVDFGGIAKGYAAELLGDMLKSNGVDAAFISLGGNIKTIGNKPDGELWRVGISSPQGGGKLLGTLAFKGEQSVVTSGSYIRNFTVDGKTYHHIIDPYTGYPVDNGLVSVTVITKDACLADGLSTAFFVMGVDSALEKARELDVSIVLVTEDSIYISKAIKEKFTLDGEIKGKYKVIYTN